MGLCSSSSRSSAAGSHDDNEAPARAVEGQIADKAAAVPPSLAPLQMPAAASHATEPAAKVGIQKSAAQPACCAAAHPPDKPLVTDTTSGRAMPPLSDGLPSFWSRRSDSYLIEGEVEIYVKPSDTLQGHRTLLPFRNKTAACLVLHTNRWHLQHIQSMMLCRGSIEDDLTTANVCSLAHRPFAGFVISTFCGGSRVQHVALWLRHRSDRRCRV